VRPIETLLLPAKFVAKQLVLFYYALMITLIAILIILVAWLLPEELNNENEHGKGQ
jgi:hypothetical protein